MPVLNSFDLWEYLLTTNLRTAPQILPLTPPTLCPGHLIAATASSSRLLHATTASLQGKNSERKCCRVNPLWKNWPDLISALIFYRQHSNLNHPNNIIRFTIVSQGRWISYQFAPQPAPLLCRGRDQKPTIPNHQKRHHCAGQVKGRQTGWRYWVEPNQRTWIQGLLDPGSAICLSWVLLDQGHRDWAAQRKNDRDFQEEEKKTLPETIPIQALAHTLACQWAWSQGAVKASG